MIGTHPPKFFSVRNNSLRKRGFPWIQSLGRGFREFFLCRQCVPARSIMYAAGPIEAVCDRRKGVEWPDVIGCGHFPFFILSESALDAFSEAGLVDLPHHGVLIQTPLPRKLERLPPPKYFWLDGKRMKGALLDFEASGFVGVRFCPECGTRTDDIGATFSRQNSRVCPFAFRESKWNGAQLFTTDLSPCVFFCTETVVDCARKKKLTNFRFIPVEEGANSKSKGLDYM